MLDEKPVHHTSGVLNFGINTSDTNCYGDGLVGLSAETSSDSPSPNHFAARLFNLLLSR